MRFLILILLISCASKLPKEKANGSAAVKTTSKNSFSLAKQSLARFADTDDEKLLFEDKETGAMTYHLIEYCRPEAIGKLELVFHVDVKRNDEGLDLKYTAKRMRMRIPGTTYLGHAKMEYQDDIWCNEDEVRSVYKKISDKLSEDLAEKTAASN